MASGRARRIGLLTSAAIAALLSVGGASAWGSQSDHAFQWGYMPVGAINSTSNRPVAVGGVTDPVALAIGASEGFALLPDGTIDAWGDNIEGQLGDGSSARSRATPVRVSGISTAVDVAAGDDFGVAVLSDGSVEGWGDGSHGNFGNGSISYANTPTPAWLPGSVAAVAAGWAHVVALTTGGGVETWGYNGQGQLGDGTQTDSDVPGVVPGLSGVAAVAAGSESSLALLRDGTIRAWGDDGRGELGDGAQTDATSPVTVTGISNATAIAAGESFALALLADGTVDAWGDNAAGELGSDGVRFSSVPLPVPGLTDVVAIAAGADTSYALRSDGTLWAWGDAGYGAVGAGSSGGGSEPVQIADLGLGTDAIASSATALSALALAHPVAEVSPASLAFGTQPQDTIGRAQTATLTNVGAPGLEETYANTVGPDADDFIKSNDTCGGQALGHAASCQVGVRFAPSDAPGTAEAATLVIGTNALASPSRVGLGGTTGALPAGPPGPPGATGPAGPVATRRAAVAVQLVTCRTRRHASGADCSVRTILLHAASNAAGRHVTVARRGIIYATGVEVRLARRRFRLVLTGRHLTTGTYTLRWRTRTQHGWRVHRATLTIDQL